MDPFEQTGFDSVAVLIGIKKRAQLVIPHFSYKPGRHSQYGRSGYGVGGRTACHILYPYGLEMLPYTVCSKRINMLHAAVRKVKSLQQGIVR
jgi:hypothetical protein